MDNKLYNTIQELERSIQSAQEEVKRQYTSPSVNPVNVFQSELNYKMQQYVHNLPSYLNFDQVLGFPIQPISYSSEANVSDQGLSIRVAIHHYPSVKPMIIEAPEMILELCASVDSSGRMEYSASRALSRTLAYTSSNTVLKASKVMFKIPAGSIYISTKFVSGATKILRVGGVATGLAGMGMTGYEIYTGQKEFIGEGGMDLIMGGVAFIPGGGWIISGVYFGGKLLLESTGNDFWNE